MDVTDIAYTMPYFVPGTFQIVPTVISVSMAVLSYGFNFGCLIVLLCAVYKKKKHRNNKMSLMQLFQTLKACDVVASLLVLFSILFNGMQHHYAHQCSFSPGQVWMVLL